MLKLCGSVLILSGSLGLGLWYRGQMYERARILGEWDRILELFLSEIRYGKATLPECCLKISGQLAEPFAESFLRIYERVGENTGVSFQEIMQQELEEAMRPLPVTEQDKKEFLAFLSETGYAEERMQRAAMEQCRERIGRIRSELEKENQKNGKLAVSMGMLGGLFLVILLI